MRENVIVLTHGWTGSSVFTALLGRAGLSAGADTFKKPDYDTHENVDLVALNDRMIQALGYRGDREHQILDEQTLAGLAQAADKLDLTPYREFIEASKGIEPWIWKDPRLVLTMHVWARLLDLERVKFIILTREGKQAWISANLRRHVQTPKFTRDYNDAITAVFRRFLASVDRSHVEFQFEDLQLRPEDTIERLNDFLGTALTMDDLRAVYTLPLHRKSKGFMDELKAWAIFLKNYGERDGRGRSGAVTAA